MKKWKPLLILPLLFFCAFCAGRLAGQGISALSALFPSSTETSVLPASDSWGLSFQEEGKPPVANTTASKMKDFDAYYMQETSEKVLYLTFDCGYENGNTPQILDALKKHQAPATFFVVGHFLETSPDLVKRMISEGHTVGNHTYHHPDMSKISSVGDFSAELSAVENLYQEITGESISPYYRSPQGKYSETNLKMAKDLGYSTFFWSLAYVDWNTDAQPSHDEAFQKLLGRVHPGAVLLLHNTSKTNAEILDELLTKFEEMGYRFQPLDELIQSFKAS